MQTTTGFSSKEEDLSRKSVATAQAHDYRQEEACGNPRWDPHARNLERWTSGVPSVGRKSRINRWVSKTYGQGDVTLTGSVHALCTKFGPR